MEKWTKEQVGKCVEDSKNRKEEASCDTIRVEKLIFIGKAVYRTLAKVKSFNGQAYMRAACQHRSI